MNTHTRLWRDTIRLKYGLAWNTASPTLADYPQSKSYILRLLFVLALWGWAMDQDYAAEQITAAISAEMRAERAERTLMDCLNGRASWLAEDGKSMVACDPAWTTKL